jgi:hypothetical protein
MEFQEAIRKVEERGDYNQYAELKPVFEARLKELKEDDYTEIGLCYYYLLIAYLKAHLSHETEEAAEYYEEMDKAFLNQFDAYLKQDRKANMSEFKDFFKLMEKCYSALELQYIKKNFTGRELQSYNRKMEYRKHSYRHTHRIFKWLEYQVLDMTCQFGISIARWAATLLCFGLFMGFIYFLTDQAVAEELKIIKSEGGHWFDYIYFSFVCLTTVGFGDIYPHWYLPKFLAAFEAFSGYMLLGIFIVLIQKRVL